MINRKFCGCIFLIHFKKINSISVIFLLNYYKLTKEMLSCFQKIFAYEIYFVNLVWKIFYKLKSIKNDLPNNLRV